MKITSEKWFVSFVSNNITLSVIFIYNIVNLCIALIFYPLIPFLMGYPPDAHRTNIELGISYTGQYFVIILISFIIGTAVISTRLRGVNNWRKALKSCIDKEEKVDLVNKIRSKYINLPYFIFLIQFIVIISLTVMLAVVRTIIAFPLGLGIKLIIIVFSLYYLVSVFTYTFSKKIMNELLLSEYKGESLAGFRLGIKNKIFMQVIPMVIVAILFTSLLGYSRLIKAKGDLLYIFCRDKLEEQLNNLSKAQNQEQVFNILQNIRIEGVELECFIVDTKEQIIYPDDNVLTSYYKYYIKHPYNGDRVYGDTEELQGVVKKIDSKFGRISVGLRFEVASPNTILVFLLGFLALMGVTVFILYYFSKSLAKDIETVAQSINEIAEGKEVDLRKRIPVTSNDEIGDLIAAFNKIREREYEYDVLRNEFFSNISHELRTPINIVLTTIQFIERYLLESVRATEIDKVKKHLTVMKKNGYRLLRLVNNIIDSTRIDASSFRVNLCNWDIVNLIEDTTNSVAEYVRGKGLDIRFETNVKEKTIACDQDLIERIMLNLLSNAVKFTGEGGRIVVGVYLEEQSINISVKDNGIGIELDKHSVIFERFGQVEHTLKRSYEGSGIGLSLVKAFVEMCGGTISVNSEYGKGSEFIVKLPVRTIDMPDEACSCEDKVDKGVEMVSIELSDIR